MTVEQAGTIATLCLISFYVLFTMVCSFLELRWKLQFHKAIMDDMAEARAMRHMLTNQTGKIIDM